MKNMIRNDRRPAGMAPEPTRLRASRSDAARVLEAYAKDTRVGERDGIASWLRFQSRLNAALDTGPASWSRRRPRRGFFASGVLTAALGLAVLVNVVPSLHAGRGDGVSAPAPAPASALPRATEGQGGVESGFGSGGASGSSETGGGGPGVGGMEGAGGSVSNVKSTGARGSNGTAAAAGPPRRDPLARCPVRAGPPCRSRVG